jgi:DNA-directed RNA polymerase subunit RPC12/RpoP
MLRRRALKSVNKVILLGNLGKDPEVKYTPGGVAVARVAVFVTKTKRPFINCGYCSPRIFYNGSCSMQLLKREFKAPKRGSSL